MITFMTVVIGFIFGFLTNFFAMKINFKQRVIDHKIKTYESLIACWIKMRNQIVHGSENKEKELGILYGESQLYVGKIFLFESQVFSEAVNFFNENFYRSNWCGLDRDASNAKLEEFKKEAIQLILSMKKSVMENTVFNRADFYLF